jgi:hypothetical protein
LVEGGDGGELEGVQALGRLEPGLPDPALDHAAFPVDQFQLDQTQQVSRMIDAIAGALLSHLVILTQHGR